jgi:hypothetical protein
MRLLLADVGPYFVNLDPATGKIAHLLVHHRVTARADLDQ